MPTTQKSKGDEWESTEYIYRGHKVEVQKHGEHMHYRLFIDGREIEMEQSESGVLSHLAMYREFGSPYELAESLIQDWGVAKIDFGKPHDHSHDS